MIRQVFMLERVTEASGATRTKTQLAFGTHEEYQRVNQDDDGQVINALAKGNQKIRVVLDELLDGSALEQISCANGTFSDIPSGTTPDDIADCAGADLSDCTNVCIDPTDGPVGILDEDEDGAADDFRLRVKENGETVVRIVCDGAVMPIDPDISFYNPSGNQQIPAGDIGVNGLGPAVVLIPRGLKTSASCGLEFDPEITDKDGNQVCAPPGGDVTREEDCDFTVDLIDFGVQPFALLGTSPTNNSMGVSVATTQGIVQFNQDVDDTSLGAITMTQAGAEFAVSPVRSTDDPSIVNIVFDNPLQPETEYVITIAGGDSGIKEVFGGALPDDFTITFTTGAAPAP